MLAIVLAVLLGLLAGPLAGVPIVLALVWTGWRWLTSYELTSERLIIRTGFLVRKREEVELFRVRAFWLRLPCRSTDGTPFLFSCRATAFAP